MVVYKTYIYSMVIKIMGLKKNVKTNSSLAMIPNRSAIANSHHSSLNKYCK